MFSLLNRTMGHRLQTEDEAVEKDEAAFQLPGQTVMIVPERLVPEITRAVT